MATHPANTVSSPVKHARLVSINVRDPDAAIAFWRDTLGFELQSDQPYGGGERWIELVPPGAETGLVLTAPANSFWREPGGYANLIFATDDVDAAHRELGARGVRFVGPIMRTEGGPPPMVFFLDRDDNQFLLVER